MATTTTGATPHLLLRAGGVACALPVAQVGETMRALPLTPLPGTPPFLLGLATIRGQSAPVLDLAALLGLPRGQPWERLVSLRFGQGRLAALAVEAVAGVRPLEPAGLPALLQDASRSGVESLARLDRELLLVLEAARLVPAEVWDLARGQA